MCVCVYSVMYLDKQVPGYIATFMTPSPTKVYRSSQYSQLILLKW